MQGYLSKFNRRQPIIFNKELVPMGKSIQSTRAGHIFFDRKRTLYCMPSKLYAKSPIDNPYRQCKNRTLCINAPNLTFKFKSPTHSESHKYGS